MKSNHWIDAHVHAYSHFGGVTRILVPDNLKTGVIKNTRTELILNRSYYEMAEHYGTAIIPARPIKPKDKPTAEGTVKVIETWILATGEIIIRYEQNDSIRAEYGVQTLKQLSKTLTAEFGKGFSRSNLQNMRSFYMNYERCQTLSGKLIGFIIANY